MFSDYASPLRLSVRERFHPPPVAFAELPPMDAVLISHDHYDHLEMATVRRSYSRGMPFFGLGVGAHLAVGGSRGAESFELAGGGGHACAACASLSARSPLFGPRVRDRNATLWTSWSVIGAAHRFYVTGDTGWSDHFASSASASALST